MTVERIGEPRSLPASLDLSAFRIVQESLTNVVKHSGADRCQVVLEYGPDSLLIEVTDPGAVPSEAGAARPAPGRWPVSPPAARSRWQPGPDRPGSAGAGCPRRAAALAVPARTGR